MTVPDQGQESAAGEERGGNDLSFLSFVSMVLGDMCTLTFNPGTVSVVSALIPLLQMEKLRLRDFPKLL